MRDSLKNQEYFEDRYARDLARFKKACSECEEALSERSQKGDEFKGKIHLFYYNIFLKFLMKFYSGYSLGLSKQELKSDISLLIDSVLKSWDGEVYADMEAMLCLAIIFGITKDDIKPILNLLIEYDYQDYVLDSMAHYIDPDFKIRTGELKFRKSSNAYTRIIKLATTNQEDAVSNLARFLEKGWLNLQTRGILNNQQHLKKDKYRGYWSIESAALVKMLNLDDEILKDCKYYPYDLLH